MRSGKHILASVLLGVMFLGAGVRLLAEPIDVRRGIADPDGKTLWYDCTLLKIEGRGWEVAGSPYDRLPAKAQDIIPASVWGLSHDSAGICVRFTTDSPTLQVRWSLLKDNLAMPHMPATGVSGVDLYGRDKEGEWRFLGNGRPAQAANTAPFTVTPGGEYILYLPLYNGVKSVEIGIPKDKAISFPAPARRDRIKPIVFYGTSITQGGCASRPGMAATAIVGRDLDVPVINLGFSGSGKMEPAIGDLLAELDPSVYVLDCLWNMDSEMVKERVEPFVRKLRRARPGIPILLVEDSSFRNVTPTGKGQIVRTVFDTLTKEGMKGLHFVSNEGMLGTDYEGTVDGCHPNDLGMMRQAAVFVQSLAPMVKAAK
ncbi:MAG: SGNH/GDSL hydrolase family protein [Candidatus Latescibacterota bacterium]